ncbi:MAG: universal stress protein [Desulfuromonadales bacterium]|nr:universal stress protein [Desulfuromonadales bacterium]
MKPRILVPINDSATTHKTIDDIISKRERFGARLVLLHVINDQLAYRMIPDFQIEMVRENAMQAATERMGKLIDRLRAAGLDVELRMEFGMPRRLIPQIANNEDFQLLVLGRRSGRGEIRDVLFGSVANYVLHNVRCPVLLF